ncbi:O-antigen ligase family protein [Thermorudis peleae]|uniref:O-antigen ligase family protein n=1 Tax=Thermorudis peleae TaxID=1382356 RepID=UPI000689D1E9|nr:O-antigen ligase family protein [Thermorudis peleae]
MNRWHALRIVLGHGWAGCFALWGLLALAFLFQGHVLALLLVVLIVGCAVLAPWSALLALPGALGFRYLLISLPVAGRTLQLSPPEVVVLAAVFAAACHGGWHLLQSAIQRRVRAQLSLLWARWTARPFSALAFGLVVLGCASLATVADPAHRHESVRELRWVILEPVAWYGLAGWYARRWGDAWPIALSWMMGTSVVALISLFRGVVGAGVAVEGVLRVSGVFPHPNALALYLERPLLLAVGLALFDTAVSRRRFWQGASLLLGITLFLTFSRGAYLGVLIGVLLLAWRHSRRALGAAVSLAAAFGLVALITAPHRMANLLGGGSGSLRLSIWQSALAMIRDFPLFGVGLDQFLYQYTPRYVNPSAWAERFTAHPHNLLLDLWLRLGLAGIALAAALVVLLVRCVGQAWTRREPLAVAALSALVAGIVHGMVDQGYFLLELAMSTWIILFLIEESGMVGVAMRTEDQQCAS